MAIFRTTPKKQTDAFEPIPVGEVTEGNSEADWKEWEDSVAFQDSHFPSAQFQSSETAFASVTKNSN